jgi:hypothetical protein
MSNIKINSLVEIDFLDHTNGDEPLRFKVWGRLKKRTKEFYHVVVWDYADQDAPHDNEDNVEGFCILRSCVKRIRRLV